MNIILYDNFINYYYMRTFDKITFGGVTAYDPFYSKDSDYFKLFPEPEKCSGKLIDEVFDEKYIDYIPYIIILTWRNIQRYHSTKYFNNSRIKNHHHPSSIYDIDIEEVNYYKYNLDVINKKLLNEICRQKNDIHNSLVKSYKLINQKVKSYLKKTNIRSGHIYGMY